MSPENETNDEKKLKREHNELVSQECRNSQATFQSFGANTPSKSIPIMNLYAESMQDPGDNVTDQDLSQYDESERGTVNAKTARETVSHSKRKGESLTLEDNSTTARSNPSNAKVSHSITLK